MITTSIYFMKGIVILVVVLALLGIWWARRTPEPVGGLQPETVNAENGSNGTNDQGDNSQNNNGDDIEPADFEDKG